MRFIEFGKPIINEVTMAPGALKKQALAINGLCGIEFELFYPWINSTQNKEDESAHDFSQIIDFFTDESVNSVRTIENILDDLYQNYTATELEKTWREHEAADAVRSYILNNEWNIEHKFYEIYNEMDLSSEEIEQAEAVRVYNDVDNESAIKNYNNAKEQFEDELEQETDRCIERQNSTYESAYDEWVNEQDPLSEHECLRDSGIYSMEDFYNIYEHHGLYWPQHTTDDEDQMEVIADNFSYELSTPATHLSRFKGEQYVVEPDSSLNPIDGYIGAEIVSPALSITEMVEDLHKVVKWANDSDCYTDRECGLHMNISIQDFDLSDLDYVKLALFLGDQWVLEKFGREANRYCTSAISNIRKNIRDNPKLAYQSLETMKSDLESMAGSLIHKSSTDKYTSINVHENRIEVRSPGGDWLNTDIKFLENLLYRFIVALNIACDPQKEKTEYAKKFYQLIKGAGWSDFSDYISQYQAGNANIADMKRILKSRNVPAPKPELPDNSWLVTTPTDQTLTVVSNTVKGAINQARTQLKLNSEQYPDRMFTVEPNKQTDIFRNF